MAHILKDLFYAVVDLVYPRYCLSCYKSLRTTKDFYLCAECISRIDYINQANTCPKCGMDMGPYTGGHIVCEECHRHPPRFTRAFAVARYDGIMRNVILEFKYRYGKVLTRPLGGLMVDAFNKTANGLKEKIDLVIPVPMHRSKLKKRGFNQSELLARYIAGSLGIGCSVGNLAKVRPSADQAGLDAAARRENLKDAFAVTKPDEVKDKTILLIDDVLTTGTTASEVARTVKRVGAKEVYVLVLARGG
ncbi:MAG: ComF family protein [Planctomycetes bacterium]|nr:ComF family protein [Planctomycetota bacterium]